MNSTNDDNNVIANTETGRGDAHRDSIGQDGVTATVAVTADESDHEVDLYKAAAALHVARQALDAAERVHRQGNLRGAACAVICFLTVRPPAASLRSKSMRDPATENALPGGVEPTSSSRADMQRKEPTPLAVGDAIGEMVALQPEAQETFTAAQRSMALAETTTEPNDAAGAAGAAGAVEALEALEAFDTEAFETANIVDIDEPVKPVDDATDAVDAAEVVGATETVEAVEDSEASDCTEPAKATEVTDSTEATTGAAGALKTTEATGGAEASKTFGAEAEAEPFLPAGRHLEQEEVQLSSVAVAVAEAAAEEVLEGLLDSVVKVSEDMLRVGGAASVKGRIGEARNDGLSDSKDVQPQLRQQLHQQQVPKPTAIIYEVDAPIPNGDENNEDLRSTIEGDRSMRGDGWIGGPSQGANMRRRGSVRFDLEPKPPLYNTRSKSLGEGAEPEHGIINNIRSNFGSLDSASSVRKITRRQSEPVLVGFASSTIPPPTSPSKPVARERGGSHDLSDELDNASLITLESTPENWSPPITPIDAAPDVVGGHDHDHDHDLQTVAGSTDDPAGRTALEGSAADLAHDGKVRRDSLVSARLPRPSSGDMGWSSLFFCAPEPGSRRGSAASAAGNEAPNKYDESFEANGGQRVKGESGVVTTTEAMPIARADVDGVSATAAVVIDDPVFFSAESGTATVLKPPSPGHEWDCFVRESSMTPPHLQHGAASVNWSPSVVAFREGGRGGGNFIPVRIRIDPGSSGDIDGYNDDAVPSASPSIAFVRHDSDGGARSKLATTRELDHNSRIRSVNHEDQTHHFCVVVITKHDEIHWAYFDDSTQGIEFMHSFRGAVEAHSRQVVGSSQAVQGRQPRVGRVGSILSRASTGRRVSVG